MPAPPRPAEAAPPRPKVRQVGVGRAGCQHRHTFSRKLTRPFPPPIQHSPREDP